MRAFSVYSTMTIRNMIRDKFQPILNFGKIILEQSPSLFSRHGEQQVPLPSSHGYQTWRQPEVDFEEWRLYKEKIT